MNLSIINILSFSRNTQWKPSSSPSHVIFQYEIWIVCYIYSDCRTTEMDSTLRRTDCILNSVTPSTVAKSRYYKEGNVQSKKRQAIRRWFVSIRHGRHVLSQCPKERHFPPVLVPYFNISGGWMPLFRALAKNMAPMTNADESPTNRLTLFPIYLALFIVSTLWQY